MLRTVGHVQAMRRGFHAEGRDPVRHGDPVRLEPLMRKVAHERVQTLAVDDFGHRARENPASRRSRAARSRARLMPRCATPDLGHAQLRRLAGHEGATPDLARDQPAAFGDGIGARDGPDAQPEPGGHLPVGSEAAGPRPACPSRCRFQSAATIVKGSAVRPSVCSLAIQVTPQAFFGVICRTI